MNSSIKSSRKVLASSILLLLLLTMLPQLVVAQDAWGTIQTKITTIICQLKTVFAATATGVAAFIMVTAGVQWVSSETDPGARKKARTTIIHAIVGLMIVMLASDIANLVLSFSCPTT